MVFTDPITLKYVRQMSLQKRNSSYSIEIAIGEESGTTGNDGSASLPPGLRRNLDGSLVNALGNIGLFDGGLQSSWTENILDRHYYVRSATRNQGTNARNGREKQGDRVGNICTMDRTPHKLCTRNRIRVSFRICRRNHLTTNSNNVHGICPRTSIRRGQISSTYSVPSYPEAFFLGSVEAYLKQKFASALHVGVPCRYSRDNAEESLYPRANWFVEGVGVPRTCS
jgi:hypothetical protein